MSFEIEEVKNRLDIVDFVGDYVELKPAGTNWKGRCPFHSEKTASFMVSREKNIWHCFGCNKGGDVFSFLQEIEHIEFIEALTLLAAKANVPLQRGNPESHSLKERLFELHTVASIWFQEQLKSSAGAEALTYLIEKRKLTEHELTFWKLGYAPPGWRDLSDFLKIKGFSPKEIRESGVVVENEKAREPYDRFRHRIQFPILDALGRVIGFGGRQLDPEKPPKYLNSPQTVLYDKGQVIYGLYQAKESIRSRHTVVLVEGYMDVIASRRAGVEHVVAVSGTALTQGHLTLLKRLTDNLIFSFDSDTAGIRASSRALELALDQGFFIKAVSIDAQIAKDPGELVEKNPDMWKDIVRQAIPFMDFLIEKARHYDLTNIQTKKVVLGRVAKWLGRITDPVERHHFVKKITNQFDVDEATVRALLVPRPNQGAPKRAPERASPTASPMPEPSRLTNPQQMAERILALLLTTPEGLETIPNLLAPAAFPPTHELLYKLLIEAYTIHKHEWSAEVAAAFFSRESAELSHMLHALLILGEDIRTALGSGYRALAELKHLATRLQVNYLKALQKKKEREVAMAETDHNRALLSLLLSDMERLTRERAHLEQETG